MSYKELKEFLKGVFPDNSGEVMDFALRAAGTSDIDSASDKKKRLFAEYILKERLEFSPERNRQIYEAMIKVIGLPPTANIAEYVLLLKNLGKREESIITRSFDTFWSQVVKGYSKFEIIINLYWQKGIEIERQGHPAKVRRVVDKAVKDLKHDMLEAYMALLGELYLRKYIKQKTFHYSKVFENLEKTFFVEKPDKLSAELLRHLTVLIEAADQAFTRLEQILLASIDDLANGRRRMDGTYVASMKSSIGEIWKALELKGKEEKIWLMKFAADLESL